MNAQELKTHRQAVMRGDLAAHLRDDHDIVDVPKTKQAQIALHDQQDHGVVTVEDAPVETNRRKRAAQVKAENNLPTTDAKSTADVSVLAGVTRNPNEAPAANQPRPKPP